MAKVIWNKGTIAPPESGDYYVIMEAIQNSDPLPSGETLIRKGDIEVTTDWYDSSREAFDSLGVAKMQNAVDDSTYSNGTAISAGNASVSYGKSKDSRDEDDGNGEGQKPQYVENNIYIDGKKAARAITPYVSKELEWEGK